MAVQVRSKGTDGEVQRGQMVRSKGTDGEVLSFSAITGLGPKDLVNPQLKCPSPQPGILWQMPFSSEKSFFISLTSNRRTWSAPSET